MPSDMKSYKVVLAVLLDQRSSLFPKNRKIVNDLRPLFRNANDLKRDLFILLSVFIGMSTTFCQEVLDPEEYSYRKANGDLPESFVINTPSSSSIKQYQKKGKDLGKPKGGSGNCGCYIEPDASYTQITNWPLGSGNTDDGSFGPVAFPFVFELYGIPWSNAYININGNVSFGTAYYNFTPNGFPDPSFVMVAPFWGDVDLTGTGIIRYKVTPTALIVNWEEVGYYSSHTDKLNTFQLILTDGTDPIIGVGNNAAFCYKDMQWTTGDASQGTNGFGGSPAVVGANKGNGIDFIQFGTFDQSGTAYDGPFGLNDGVDWLDNKSFVLNTAISGSNIAPVVSGLNVCDTLTMCVGEVLDIEVTFLSPEPSQTTSGTSSALTLSNYTETINTVGINAVINGQIIGAAIDVGFHLVSFSATDDGTPPLTSFINVVVEVLPTGSTDAGADGISCDLSYTLDADPVNINSGIWTGPSGSSFNDPSDPNSLVTMTSGGNYTFYWTEVDSNSCDLQDSVIVTFTEPIHANLSTLDASCFGACDGTVVANPTGGNVIGSYTYNWSGNIAGPNDDNAIDLCAGLYTVTVLDDNNCFSDTTFVINEPPPPDAGPDGISCDLTYTLGAIPINVTIGEWSGPAGASFSDSTDPNALATMTIGGTFMFYWTEDDNLTCLVTDSVQITFTSPIYPVLTTTDAICFDACNGTAQTAAIGGNVVGSYTYIWSNGIAGPNADNANGICDGTYTVTVIDDNNCSSDTTFIINEPPPMVIDAINVVDETCFGDCDGQLEIIASTAVLYSFNGGNTFDPANTQIDLCAGVYNIVIQDIDGCEAIGMPIISGPPLVEAEFSHNPQPANVLEPDVYFLNNSTGASSYLWDFGGLGSSTEYQPTYEFPNSGAGVYEVCLTATNNNGCFDAVCQLVIVEENLLIYVPNSFTPNADGTNDWFGPSFNIVVAEYSMLVFDRWGSIIYETNNPHEPWTGTYKNNGNGVVQEGVYVWKIRVRDANTGINKDLFGHVTLLK